MAQTQGGTLGMDASDCTGSTIHKINAAVLGTYSQGVGAQMNHTPHYQPFGQNLAGVIAFRGYVKHHQAIVHHRQPQCVPGRIIADVQK